MGIDDWIIAFAVVSFGVLMCSISYMIIMAVG